MRIHLFPQGLLAAIVAGLLLLGGPQRPQELPTAAAAADGTIRTISVSGHGEVTLTPDLATVHLGVETTGRTAQEAMDRNSQAMDPVVAKIKALGVDEKDIQTTGVSLYPIRIPRPLPRQEGEPTTPPEEPMPAPGEPSLAPAPEPGAAPAPIFRGYRASNTVRVTIRDLSKVATVIDGAVGAGATMVSGVFFGLSDETRGQREALVAAARAARTKATTLAEALGITITGVHSVTEGGFVGPPILRAGPTAGGVPTPIEPGQLTVATTVTVIFLIG